MIGKMCNAMVREVCLSNEVDTSIRLIKKGLGEIQRIDGGNDFYYPPIILLANGFEKLMKCILCYYIRERDGRYPNRRELMDLGTADEDRYYRGHNLGTLLQHTIDACRNMNYGQSVATRQDIEFLTGDDHLRRIIEVLSNFAQGGRYYNLNIVTSSNSRFESPEDIWQELETEIVMHDDDLREMMEDPTRTDEMYEGLNHQLIVLLERFSRALSRLFTLAELGVEAERCMGYVGDFLFLGNDQLGTRIYE